MGERLHHIAHIKQLLEANLGILVLKSLFRGPPHFLIQGTPPLLAILPTQNPVSYLPPHSLFFLSHYNQLFSHVLLPLHLLQINKFLSLTDVARLVLSAWSSTDTHAFWVPSSTRSSFEAFFPPLVSSLRNLGASY